METSGRYIAASWIEERREANARFIDGERGGSVESYPSLKEPGSVEGRALCSSWGRY
jgi:hypothetical protein